MDTPGELLRYVADVLEDLGLSYAVGGSFASSAYGEPRYTRDVDVIVALPPERVPEFVARFPPPDFYVDAEVARQAAIERGMFNIIHAYSAIKIDIYIPDDAVARDQIARSRRITGADGVSAAFSAPEELIIKKLQFYRMGEIERHLRDVAAMLRVSGEEIDRERIRQLAAQEGLSDLWQAILRRLEGS